MNKHSFKIIAITFTLVAAICIAVTYHIAIGGLEQNMKRRAFSDLSSNTTHSAAHLQHHIEQQYSPLESLAAFLSTCDDPREAFLEQFATNNAAVLANRLCMLGYADMDGNAISYEGESLGNISDRKYFQDATFWKGEYSIEYMASTALTSEPRILFGVPVLKNNNLVGMIFCAKEIDSFEKAIFASGFDGNEMEIIIDSDGTIVAAGGNYAGRFSVENIFDEYSSDVICDGSTLDSILANIAAGKAGTFTANCSQEEYVAYAPIGIADWYMFGITSSSAAQTSFAPNVNNYMRVLYVFSAFFIFTLVAILLITGQYTRKIKKDKALIDRQTQRYHTILSEMMSAVYNYDVATQRLTISEAFDKMFGYPLLETWTAEVKENASKHPEIDYESIMKAKSHVELSGEPTQVVIRAQSKLNGLRWFRITMNPLFDEDRHMLSIYGLVIDVTDEQEDDKQFALERERLLTAVRALFPIIISINLSRNSYKILNGKVDNLMGIALEGTLDNLIAEGAATVYKADLQRFIEVFSRKSVLAAFSEGKTEVELESCHQFEDGSIKWIRTQAVQIENRYDDDVLGIVLIRNIDQQKAYQALLQRTYDLTIENIPSFVAKWIFVDGDVLLLEANEKYLDFMKVSASEAFEHSIIYGFSAQEKSDLLAMLYESERERKPISFTRRACKANGDECYLQVQAVFFEEKEGKSVYYAALTEVTELVKTQQKLKEAVSELSKTNEHLVTVNSYRSLINKSLDGGMMVYSAWDGKELKLQYASPGLLHTLGYTMDEFAVCFAAIRKEIVHPDDYERTKEVVLRNCHLGDHFSIEYRIRSKDGQYIWMIEHSQVLESIDDAHELSVACLLTNITHQKELEQQLRVSEEEYRIAANLSDHTVLTFDIANRCFLVIAPGKSTVNFAKELKDIPESVIREGYIAPESIDTIRELFNGICQGVQTDSKTAIAIYTCEEKKHWMEASYSLTHDDTGNPVTAIMIFEDVTDRYRAEQLFRISNAFLNRAQKAAKLMVCNLTTATLDYETEGIHGMLTQKAQTNDLHAIIAYVIKHTVHPDDAATFSQFFAPERFLDAIKMEVFEESFEYRSLIADGIYHWMNVQTRIETNSNTRELLLYAIFSDINEQKQAELALMRKAQTDSLTGLMNRDSFEEEVAIRFADSANRERKLFDSIVMIDIDRFKQINDTLGHDEGDAVLKNVAQQIRSSLRADDLVARFGGDEFIVMLPGMPSEKMIQERCARICEKASYEVKDGISISVSLGIAIRPDDGVDYLTLFKKADAAMYQAKRNGGNSGVRYSPNGLQQIHLADDSAVRVKAKKVFARTFGYFDIFIDGAPMHFTNAKEKELLAILIDRNGGTLTADEAIAYLWEDEPAGERQNARYRKLAMNLRNTLQGAGIENILIVNRGIRSIDTTKLECDYYQFLKNNPEFRRLYHGAYMSNYSWAENTVSVLNDIL